ncbi:toll/interleukin-1 receptor domain-containing protein [Actinosynnema sp. NPDC004786]
MVVGRPPGHAFISYVREDALRADRVQRALEAAGVEVWRDTRDLWPGQDWKIEIRRAITHDSLVFIACFSEVSEKREISYQYEELNQAVEQMRVRRPGRPWIIPIRFAECTLPDFDLGAGKSLDSLQRIDLFDGHWDEGIAKLVRVVVHALESDDQPRLLTRRRLLSAAGGAALVYVTSTSADTRGRPDNGRLASGASHTVEIGNPQQWETGHWGLLGVADIAFTRDGALIATGGNETLEGTTRLWDTVSHQRVQILTGGAAPVAFSASGRHLATGTSDSQVRVWDMSSFTSSPPLATDNLQFLTFVPGTDLVVGGSGNGRLQTWDVTSATLVASTTTPHIVDAVAFDQDRNMITCGLRSDVSGKGSVVVWDVTSARRLHEFPEMGRPTMVNPDGTLLVAAGAIDADGNAHNLVAWDLPADRQIAVLLEEPGFTVGDAVIAFRPDGRMFAVGFNGRLHLWNSRQVGGRMVVDEAAKSVQVGDGSSITSIAFSEDGKMLAAGDNNAILYLWQFRSLSGTD